MLAFVHKPHSTVLLFDHTLEFLSSASQHCYKQYQANPSAINLLVACMRNIDIRTRAAGLSGILRLYILDSEKEITVMDPTKYIDAVKRRWPDHLTDVLMDYGMMRTETFILLGTMRDFQKAMMQIVQDHDFYGLGLKLAEYILRTEFSVSQGAWQVQDPRTGKMTVDSMGLPFTMWVDALPHCAKALRARGSFGELDKADIIDLKFLITKARHADARAMASKCIERSSRVGFFYYALTLGADLPDGLRAAKKGLKCPDLTDYVRFGLLYRAAEHAMSLALAKLEDAMLSGKNLEEGFAFAMTALEDSKTFIQEAPPDTRNMKSLIYIHTLSLLLVKGHELNDDLKELKEAKAKLKLADDIADFLGRPVNKTQMRKTCTTVIDRMEQAWKEWSSIVPQFAHHVPRELSAAHAEDDLATWLDKIDIEDPDILGGHQHDEDGHFTHPKVNLNTVELYRCSWCRNPSAVLRKCTGCEKNEISRLKKLWGTDDIALNGQNNTIHLRADWRAMFEADRWMFVPSETTLKRVINYLLHHMSRRQKPTIDQTVRLFARSEYILVPLDLGSLNAIARASSGNADPNIKPPYDRQISLGYSDSLNPYFVIQRAWSQFSKVLLLNTYKVLEVHGRAYADLRTIVGLWEDMADFPKIEGDDDIPECIVRPPQDIGSFADYPGSFADLPPRKRTKRTRQEVGRPSKKGRGK
ncbi:hypothetical protein EW146_g9890 [Bondarzewia mesenterica]|uniref:Uncharacterized protein n=1 Tax=Bondarzewia mesenterica TaxID=1095465 RepID=A0A4S4L2C4_9AGAM|nr:hypothetical protein EW146_g9890 [Bondarzewia mesenterica]